MHLEKLEIQGFKSFGSKNILKFPGWAHNTYGLTAVVGPNGSGKSNIADAIRWVLGEQSLKTLRGKKSEDVIFSGSDKKSKLGMAEVSLYLNNEDGRVDLEYPQIVLTRRLYRSGESEYLINNAKVRLLDVQLLLAKANFGQRTYSVIGQGTVENFLNTTASERKEFFDEATGVRKYQIKRDASLNQLEASKANLQQASLLLVEIEPRLKSLTRQMAKLKKKEDLKQELRTWQISYYGGIWQDLNSRLGESGRELVKLEKDKEDLEKKIAQLNQELTALEEKLGKKNVGRSLRQKGEAWQAEREELLSCLARVQTRLELERENSASGARDWLEGRQRDLTKSLTEAEAEIKTLRASLERKEKEKKDFNEKRDKIVKRLSSLSDSLAKLSREAGQKFNLEEFLQDKIARLDKISQTDDLADLKKVLAEILGELREAIKLAKSGGQNVMATKLATARAEIDILNRKKEEEITRINESNMFIYSKQERIKMLEEKRLAWRGELASVEKKLAKKEDANLDKLVKEKESLTQNLRELEKKQADLRHELETLLAEEEKERRQILAGRDQLQDWRRRLDVLNQKAGDYRIAVAKLETRLEDWQEEAKNEMGEVDEAKKYKGDNKINEAEHKIRQIKIQLETIGGIDPETEKEYLTTKERFEFLDSQSADLNSAILSLEKIIKELDRTINEQFEREFETIAKKFEEYFKILFNGGQAKIVKLTQEATSEVTGVEDEAKATGRKRSLATAGIDIQATPPGKKIKSISMLSGGERALTAVALLCAIISANPSPFVVLDEVDASLDEANSERLAKILTDLSHKTQFIVITHNRSSMKKATILYGVTMGEEGVSKLLSVKLEDAK